MTISTILSSTIDYLNHLFSSYPWLIFVLIAIFLIVLFLKFGKDGFQIIFYILGIIALLKFLSWI